MAMVISDHQCVSRASILLCTGRAGGCLPQSDARGATLRVNFAGLCGFAEQLCGSGRRLASMRAAAPAFGTDASCSLRAANASRS